MTTTMIELTFWQVIVLSALCFGVGCALAYLWQGRALSRLRVLLSQAENDCADAEAVCSQWQTQLEDTRAALEGLREALQSEKIENGTLKAQLEGEQTAMARLEAQIRKLENECATLDQHLQDARQSAHDAEKKRDALQAELKAQAGQREEDRARLESLTARLEAIRAERDQLQTDLTRMNTELEERQASYARELERFEEQKQLLQEQFRNLSNEILEAKARSLQESSQKTLHSVLEPFKSAMDAFKKEVQDIHHRETLAQGELKKELNVLKTLNEQITQEAHELSTALKGQKKLQGNWGELVLDNVLERSGLQAGKDYRREVSFTTEDGERKRPDVVVYLPQDKHLIIDAKVSLNAYTRYVNADDEVERQMALKEHVSAVKSRISELAARDYGKLPGINSPEVVFMFIPIESAFVEAMKADEEIFQEALNQNVLVATPTTLLTSLNIVRQLWRYEDQNKHTAELAQKAERVFKKLNTFLASFEKIKKALDNATEAYNTAEGQLLSGRGNLVKQVSDFRQLAPKIQAQLPAYFVEKAELELDWVPSEEASASEANQDEVTDSTSEKEEASAS